MALKEIVIEHYKNPCNLGELDQANAVGYAENAACGDIMHLYLQVVDGVVQRATFKSFGCAPSIAAGSVLTQLLVGATVEQAQVLGRAQVDAALGGLPPLKNHCAVLAEDALKRAMDQYQAG
ncbi:MAG: iron-sulfur cluster assembly scaffold protein [Candidatus Latescibacteria bacterium]|nr:iron-sulfur cluster assembly scaffold protein [Candidatus Latescibacterota bacterium]